MSTRNLKLIQTGDWHLSANESSWTESGFTYRQARLGNCLSQILKSARSADFLLLTGDLIDSMEGDGKLLSWLHKKMSSLGKDKVIATYGSHDKSVRDLFSSITAPRSFLGSDVYSIEKPSFDTVFYAVDSAIGGSRHHNFKNAVEVICKARRTKHKSFGRALLLAHVDEREYRSHVGRLNGHIDYSALGHCHSYKVLTGLGFFAAYSGAPVARDGCTDGDNGARWFIRVNVQNTDTVTPTAIPLPVGGCQVKVTQSGKSIILSVGPTKENKSRITDQALSDFPNRVIETIHDMTRGSWTSIALAYSVEHRQEIIDQLLQEYRDSVVDSFATERKGKKGGMHYFFRSDTAQIR